jgi:hypothetical protein
MAYRTLHTFGTVSGTTAATVRVNNQIVHQGSVESGLLFEFITDVTLHGNVLVSIDIDYGELTLTHNRVTYPALIRGKQGHVNMPQPIVQPNWPLVVSKHVTYKHYMINGPTQWLVDSDTDTNLVVVDDFYQACIINLIFGDFQYDAYLVDINKFPDISELE